MKRKILMMCSIWHEDYIYCLLRGIQKRIAEEELEIHVFAVFDHMPGSEYMLKEQEIFRLPDPRNYDAILVAVNSTGNIPVVEKILEQCRAYGKKVLSIDQRYEDASFIGIDNYQIFYDMVEHMITVHGCKVFNYLGGPEDHEENKERYKAFCDCLNKHQIPVEKDRVLHYSFMNNDGMRAYESWKQIDKHLPDALICANDNMALGYCGAAEADGYYPPEDFIVSGFDNLDMGQFYSPSLTSVNRNWEHLGYESVHKLLQLMNEEIEQGNFSSVGKLALNESCGCALDKRDVREDLRHVYREKRYEERLEVRQRLNRQLLCSSGSIEELQQNLEECFNLLGGMNIALCLNESLFQGSFVKEKHGYEQTMEAVNAGGQKKIDMTEELSPAEVLNAEGHKVFIFSALHFSSTTYGFCMAAYEDTFLKNNLFRTFMETLGLAFESIRQRDELSRMNQRLKELYIQDPLTGLYNRFGYVTLAEEFFKNRTGEVYLMYIDIDNLKLINDNYDHSMGDKAITGVAKAIKEVFAGDAIRVRMGGDEFLVMGSLINEEELMAKEEEMRVYLEEYSDQEELPFVLRASIGHVCSDNQEETLETLVKKADAKMYEVKQKRKTRSRR